MFDDQGGGAAMTWALLAYFALFFGTAFVWPTLRLWRRDRVNALVLPRDDSIHGVLATWFRRLVGGVFLLLALLAGGVSRGALGPLAWAEGPVALAFGSVLLAASLIWIVAAQAHMGGSWRIGIDTGSRPPLVRRGLFGRSRNPIFLGMRVGLAGLFLVLPNAFTLAGVLVGEALVQLQVRLEEAHLAEVFGADYDDYRRAVPRWL